MSADPSHSRIYLTSSNNPYGSIHSITEDPSVRATRQQKNDLLINHRSDAVKRKITPLLKSTPKQPQNSHFVDTELSSPIRSQPAMASPVDIDPAIYAPPESSDEENPPDIELDTTTNEKSKGAKREPFSPKRPLNNRDTNTDATRRSKRRKTSDEQLPPSTMPEKGSDRMQDNDMFFSSLSQESRPRKRYVKSSSQGTSFSQTSSAPQKKPAINTLRPVSESPSPERKPKKARFDYKTVSSSPSAAPSPRRKTKIKHVESSPKEPEDIPRPRPGFQEVEGSDSDNPQTSNTTTDTSKSTLFNKSNTKPLHTRRDSSSSLSSIVSFSVTDSPQYDPFPPQSQTDPLPHHHILCPTCRRPTSLQNLPGHSPTINPATLPLRQQTNFCYDHRIRDAQETWSKNEYPTINWDTLPSSTTLQTQLTRLIPLLRRKIPSHYLSTLDSAITSAKGNQSTINRIFDVTNIHHGYYGPRGAKIITNAVMDDEGLQKQLGRSLRSDKSMRVAGLGRLTDCVLVPEVLVGLVQEDLVLGGREEAGREARKVLEESGELGLLLCGGDDEVDGDGEEDRDGDGDVQEIGCGALCP